MPFPKVGTVSSAPGSNISSQAYTNDPEKLVTQAKFAVHITDKFQLATAPLIVNKQALLEDKFKSAASTFNIGSNTSAQTKALFSAFGVTQGRPEILTVVDFEPIFKLNAIDKTDAGAMFDAQIQMRALRTEKILKFRDQLIASSATAGIVDELRLAVIDNLSKTAAYAYVLVDINGKTQNVERALNLHNVVTATAVKKTAKLFRSSTGVDFDVYTPKALLVDVLGFGDNAVDNFMSTKIMLQLLSAFKGTLNNYSIKLFDSKFGETTPADDSTPANIIAPDYQNTFQFTTDVIRSTPLPFDVLHLSHYNKLLETVPDDVYSKVALFMHTIARELKVSAGITRKDAHTIVKAKTNGNFSKIFDSIIGDIGSNVFTHLPNPANLAGIVKINSPTIDGDILPFEGHEIIYQHNTFVPAKTFVDAAKTFNGTSFNTAPLRDFTNNYDTATSLMTSLIEKLLFLFDKSTMLNTLSAENQLAAMLGHVAAVVNVFGGGITGTNTPWPEGDQLLLIKAAAANKEIRYNLFRAFAYHAVDPATLTKDSFWWHLDAATLSQDYNTIKAALLSELKLYAIGQMNVPLEGDIDWGTSRTWDQIESSIDNMFKSSNKKMPLNHVKAMIDSLFSAAQALSDTSIMNEQSLTMFNNIHPSTIAYMIFDTYISLVDLFSVVGFSQSQQPTKLQVRASVALNKASAQYLLVIPAEGIGDTLEQSITDKFVAQNGGKLYKAQSDLIYRKTLVQHCMNRLRFEEGLVRSFVSLFKAISINLVKATDEVLDVLDLTNNENKTRLSFLTSAVETQTQASLFDRSQVVLIIENIERLAAAVASQFPVAFLGQFNYKQRHVNALNAWLREAKMLEKNLRVLTVGIPAGTMSGMLSQQINVDSNDETSAQQQLPRPVEIRVYAKSLEYPVLIFKPQQFFFDVDRFVEFEQLDESFDSAQITFAHVINNIEQRARASSNAIILSQGKGPASLNYGGAAGAIEHKILACHVESELLKHYTKLLSGVSTDELDFPTNSNIITAQHSKTSLETLLLLINRYLNDIAGDQLTIATLKQTNPAVANLLAALETTQTIVEKTGAPINVTLPGATSNQLINLTEGIVNFLDTFSADSFLNDGSTFVNRILAPKLFERIFHVAVNPSEFIIDIEKTAATSAGATFLSTMTNTLLISMPNGNLKLRPELVDISMHELFTTVSTVGAY